MNCPICKQRMNPIGRTLWQCSNDECPAHTSMISDYVITMLKTGIENMNKLAQLRPLLDKLHSGLTTYIREYL